MVLKDVLDDPTGSKIVSAVIGLGFALMFQKICKGNNCVIIQGPNPKEVEENYYKIEDQCYKYKPYPVHCDK